MNSIIVGTVGHVDHGKTCLIKALTGTDTDRLKEEKKRGITIELGFAEMCDGCGRQIGIIDVPGHERFIRNMLAGIGGIDLVLLVVAADEGVMPQTVEHFEIISMLGISQGIIVITKADLVDKEWLTLVQQDIRDMVAGTFLEGADEITVSAHTGQNIEQLKQMIWSMIENCRNRKSDPSLMRLPIDRVFTIGGFGTVVTGTLFEGAVSVGDEIMIYPAEKPAKIRNLQVHGNMVDQAFAGQRTAINLMNVKKEELGRGAVLAAKGTLMPSMMLDVELTMFADSARTVENGSRLHLYVGSSEVICKVVLLDRERLEKGQSGFAQLRLEEAVAVKKEDRFIVRFYSPVESIGGGIVLDPNPRKHKRFQSTVIEALLIRKEAGGTKLLAQALKEESKRGITIKDLTVKLGWTKAEIHTSIQILQKEGIVLKLTDNWFIHKDYFEEVTIKAENILDKYHKEYPISYGMAKEEFRKKLATALYLPERISTEPLVEQLVGKCKIKEADNTIAHAAFTIEYTEAQIQIKERIIERYLSFGYEVFEVDEVIASEKDKVLAKQIVTALIIEGQLEKMTYPYLIHRDCWEKALDILQKHIQKEGQITLGEYRDLLNTSRKYAMMILDAMDTRKVTRKTGDVRVLA